MKGFSGNAGRRNGIISCGLKKGAETPKDNGIIKKREAHGIKRRTGKEDTDEIDIKSGEGRR